MATAEGAAPRWRRSSACLPSECVEVASHGGYILVRDSADAAGMLLEFENDQWRNFIRKLSSSHGSGRKAPRAAMRP
jgi:hypothetical protein